MTLRFFMHRSRQQLHRAPLRQRIRSGGNACGDTPTQVRWVSTLSPPTAPPAPTLPSSPSSPPLAEANRSTGDTQELPDESFRTAFEHAVHDVAALMSTGGQPSTVPPATASSTQLSPWLQYLVGLRNEPPSAEGTKEQLQRSHSFASVPSHGAITTTGTAAAMDNVFLHHVFDNAREAALYVSVRQPREFLRPEPVTKSMQPHLHGNLRRVDCTADEWSLIPFSSVLYRLEHVLQEMAQLEVAKWNDTALHLKLNALSKGEFQLTFWRAMLEQAFLEQYCEVSALDIALMVADDRREHRHKKDNKSSDAAQTRTVFDLYPYDYREQPVELRWRLEQCIRALLCASAFTLHAQWEQYMTRHARSDTVAHVLGLEFILLWWYANPDQVPVELTSSVHRLPPCTLRQQVRLAEAGNSGTLNHPMSWQSSMTAAGNGTTVEQHLREYITNLYSATTDAPTCGKAKWYSQYLLNNGGFLCPAAVFPPSYRNALRACLRQVRHRSDFITCPLFVRVLEVAVMVSSVSPESWLQSEPASVEADKTATAEKATARSIQDKRLQAAARRGRQIAEHLVVDWLWPTVCSTPTTAVGTQQFLPLKPVHELVHPAAGNVVAGASDNVSAVEKTEDWAVLVAVVTAVALVRGHMLELRRGTDGGMQCTKASGEKNSDVDQTTNTSDRAIAYIRDHMYTPAMRVLLCAASSETKQEGTPDTGEVKGKKSLGNANAEMPSWIYLVFARVVFCFQDCGWLRRNVAQQPATPARLWHQLFHTIGAAFVNVFYAGNTVTALWVHWVMEGVAAAPSTYHRAFQPLNKGREETLQAWASMAAQSQMGSMGSEKSLMQSSIVEVVGKTDVNELLNSQFITGEGSLCPHAELRERSAYAAAASLGEWQQMRVEPLSMVEMKKKTTPQASHRSSRHGRWGNGGQVPRFPSFASPFPTAPPPPHLSTEAACTQMQAYLMSSREMKEEVTSVLVEVFRHYATLPTLRPATGAPARALSNNEASMSQRYKSLSSEGVMRLQHMGQPSFFVLLKLLHSLAVFGDTFTDGDRGDKKSVARVPGLVPSVLRDTLAVCHPVVASYLRRLQVYSATVSGRDGATALLFDDELQAQLNSLPPQMGRRRLVVALLWSGLPASALTQAQEAEGREGNCNAIDIITEESTFGSGSLAWHVLGSNQQRFFSTLPLLTSSPAKAGAQPLDSEDAKEPEAQSEPPDTNSPNDVCGLVEEVIKHLWQLAIVVPEPARVTLHLFPHMCAQQPSFYVDTPHAEAPTEAAGNETLPVETKSVVIGGSNEQEVLISATNEADTKWEVGNADDNEYDTDFDAPSAWIEEAEENASATHRVMDEVPLAPEMMMMEGIDPEDFSTQWSSQEALRSSATATQRAIGDDGDCEDPSEEEGHLNKSIDESKVPECYHALVAALRPALPASQHLFFSLLEVLAWVANAQQSRTALATSTDIDSGSSPRLLKQVGRDAWCAHLSTYYHLCTSVWAAHAGLRQEVEENEPDSIASACAVKGSVLCRFKLMVQVLLIVCQTCPDLYLLSLLLINLALRGAHGPLTSSVVQTFLTLRWQHATSLFPWSVECAVAQLLYHAGVTFTSVLRWRTLSVQAAATVKDEGCTTTLDMVKMHYELLTSFSNTHNSLKDNAGTVRFRRAANADPPPFLPRPSVETQKQNNTDKSEATQKALLMSIGSLLLASLHLRLRTSTGRRQINRYNFYVNEFLLNSLADTSETNKREETSLRAVLPSVQLHSRSPSAGPPQQVQSLRRTWQYELTFPQREVLRRCFRGKNSRGKPQHRQVVHFCSCESGGHVGSMKKTALRKTEQDYVATFL